MKRIVISTLFIIAATTGSQAQTYLETLRKDIPGQGHVTVTQSKEIDDLVNGTPTVEVAKPKAEPEKATAKKDKKAEGAVVHFVLPERIGHVVTMDLDVDEVTGLLTQDKD